MREIEFRGKALEDDEYFNVKLNQWLYGNLSIDKLQKQVAIEDTSKEDISCINVDPYSVGQYTGLTDKNGKMIFEGDIVKCDGYFDNPQLVKWNNEWCAFEPIFDARPIEAFPILGETNRIEVIGNIYDNPELLEV